MSQGSAHRLMRHLNGAHALGYVGLGPTYSLDNFLRHYQRQHQLFSIAEWQRLRKIGVDGNGNAYREAVAWAMQDLMAERHTGAVEPQVLTEMMQLVCRLRGGIGALYDYAWQVMTL